MANWYDRDSTTGVTQQMLAIYKKLPERKDFRAKDIHPQYPTMPMADLCLYLKALHNSGMIEFLGKEKSPIAGRRRHIYRKVAGRTYFSPKQ